MGATAVVSGCGECGGFGVGATASSGSVCRFADFPGFRLLGFLVFQLSRFPTSWCVGFLVYQLFGFSTCWNVGEWCAQSGAVAGGDAGCAGWKVGGCSRWWFWFTGGVKGKGRSAASAGCRVRGGCRGEYRVAGCAGVGGGVW